MDYRYVICIIGLLMLVGGGEDFVADGAEGLEEGGAGSGKVFQSLLLK